MMAASIDEDEDNGAHSLPDGADDAELGGTGVVILAGGAAVEFVADTLCRRIEVDPRFEGHLGDTDMSALAEALQSLVLNTFGGERWPPVELYPELVEESFDAIAALLCEQLDEAHGEPSDGLLVTAVEALEQDRLEDERLQSFFERLRAGKLRGSSAHQSMMGSEFGQDGLSEEQQLSLEGPAAAAKSWGGDDETLNVSSFGELRLNAVTIEAMDETWKAFSNLAESREAAGEAIYSALLEALPSIGAMFTSPRPVQAVRFMNGFDSFLRVLDEPRQLRALVEEHGFRHLHLEVDMPRVLIFRDAIMDLLAMELEERFMYLARIGWRDLLNYIGSSIIYIKAHYAERIQLLLSSWAEANHNDKSPSSAEAQALKDLEAESDAESSSKGSSKEEGEEEGEEAPESEADTKKDSKTSSFWRCCMRVSRTQRLNVDWTKHGESRENLDDQTQLGQAVPTTYPEMFLFNAAVMGFEKHAWMTEVLARFSQIVTSVSNPIRLQEECDIIVLRLAKSENPPINLAEYKSCMLASLRALLPKLWDPAHELAWSWLWDHVEKMVSKHLGQPVRWLAALRDNFITLSEDELYDLRAQIYVRFFASTPQAQDYFKKSKAYLHFIAEKILSMVLELYKEPGKMVDDISAIGLHHVGYGVPPELIGPFVASAIEAIADKVSDATTMEAFHWAFGFISRMLVRTLREGSTIVMKAINQNSRRMLQKALACAPRGERTQWMLTVQVGTQSISPLAWAIERGCIDIAAALIQDLLTFRADRDRYYYSADQLFNRHPDIIRILCQGAPGLVPQLLDGLVWRSRVVDRAGLRRVNYYVKHLLVGTDGQFSKGLAWITETNDPKLACHPVVVLVMELLWGHLVYSFFLFGQTWLLLTIAIFVFSQSIMHHLTDEHPFYKRAIILGCRSFIYCCSLTQLIFRHFREWALAYRTSATCRVFCLPLPAYLGQWQDLASFFLMLLLIAMLCMEPLLWCLHHHTEELFDEHCVEQESSKRYYHLASSLAGLLYYVLLVDLTIVSTRISAFVLMCVRMLPKLALFLGALCVTVLAFSSAINAFELEMEDSNAGGIHARDDVEDFSELNKGSVSLLRMVLGMYAAESHRDLQAEPIIFAMCVSMLVVSCLFFVNLLVAQLSCTFSFLYADMVGFSRLERCAIIVELMPSVSKQRWTAFLTTLRLDERLEFGEGDIGLPGGVACLELANLNPTTQDRIRRFGGSTAPENPWPEEEQQDYDENERFLRIEQLLRKTMQKVGSRTVRGRIAAHAASGAAGAKSYEEHLSSQSRSWGVSLGESYMSMISHDEEE